MIDQRLLDILACPVCKMHVELRGEALRCQACKLDYPIRDGIPVMLPDEATPAAGGGGQPKTS